MVLQKTYTPLQSDYLAMLKNLLYLHVDYQQKGDGHPATRPYQFSAGEFKPLRQRVIARSLIFYLEEVARTGLTAGEIRNYLSASNFTEEQTTFVDRYLSNHNASGQQIQMPDNIEPWQETLADLMPTSEKLLDSIEGLEKSLAQLPKGSRNIRVWD